MTQNDTQAQEPLATRLKRETAQAHEQAENSTFMTELMGGNLDKQAFIDLQEQSLLFYSALEGALDSFAQDPCVQYVADRRLDRVQHLRHDIEQLGGNTQPEPLPATAEYVATLERIAKDGNAAEMIAHHYVRYLGDLSGGQVVASKMKNLLGVPEEALTFYRFDGIGKLKPYKDTYRAALDKLQALMSSEEQDQMAIAAGEAFTCNHNVFVNLGKIHHN